MHDNEEGTNRKKCSVSSIFPSTTSKPTVCGLCWNFSREHGCRTWCGEIVLGSVKSEGKHVRLFITVICIARYSSIACCILRTQQRSRRNLKDKTSGSLLLHKRKRHWIYEWRRAMCFGEKCKETKRQRNDSRRHGIHPQLNTFEIFNFGNSAFTWILFHSIISDWIGFRVWLRDFDIINWLWLLARRTRRY